MMTNGANSVIQGIAVLFPRWFPAHETSAFAYVVLALVWLAVLVAGARYQLGRARAEYTEAVPHHA
jgi:hypothetical protein